MEYSFRLPSGEVCVLMACSEKPSVTGGLFSLSRALWCGELFLFEVHPSILLASSGTGCGASCEAADTACAEKPSVHARTCAAVSASLCASLTPQHLVYTSQLAVLNHSWWLAVCEFENKPLPVFSLGTTLEGYWLIPSSVNIDSFFCFVFLIEVTDKFQERFITRSSNAPLQAEGFVASTRLMVHAARLRRIMVRYVMSVFCEDACILFFIWQEWTGNSLRFSGFSGVDKAVSVHWEGAQKWKQ